MPGISEQSPRLPDYSNSLLHGLNDPDHVLKADRTDNTWVVAEPPVRVPGAWVRFKAALYALPLFRGVDAVAEAHSAVTRFETQKAEGTRFATQFLQSLQAFHLAREQQEGAMPGNTPLASRHTELANLMEGRRDGLMSAGLATKLLAGAKAYVVTANEPAVAQAFPPDNPKALNQICKDSFPQHNEAWRNEPPEVHQFFVNQAAVLCRANERFSNALLSAHELAGHGSAALSLYGALRNALPKAQLGGGILHGIVIPTEKGIGHAVSIQEQRGILVEQVKTRIAEAEMQAVRGMGRKAAEGAAQKANEMATEKAAMQAVKEVGRSVAADAAQKANELATEKAAMQAVREIGRSVAGDAAQKANELASDKTAMQAVRETGRKVAGEAAQKANEKANEKAAAGAVPEEAGKTAAEAPAASDEPVASQPARQAIGESPGQEAASGTAGDSAIASPPGKEPLPEHTLMTLGRIRQGISPASLKAQADKLRPPSLAKNYPFAPDSRVLMQMYSSLNFLSKLDHDGFLARVMGSETAAGKNLEEKVRIFMNRSFQTAVVEQDLALTAIESDKSLLSAQRKLLIDAAKEHRLDGVVVKEVMRLAARMNGSALHALHPAWQAQRSAPGHVIAGLATELRNTLGAMKAHADELGLDFDSRLQETWVAELATELACTAGLAHLAPAARASLAAFVVRELDSVPEPSPATI